MSDKWLQKEIGILQTAWWSRTLFHVTLSTIEEMLNPVRKRGENWGPSRICREEDAISFLGYSCCLATLLVELTSLAQKRLGDEAWPFNLKKQQKPS